LRIVGIFGIFGWSFTVLAIRWHAVLRPIRANAQGEIIIPNLAEVEVTGAEQFHTRFASALAKRKLAPTKLNSTSSRSHAVRRLRLGSSPSI